MKKEVFDPSFLEPNDSTTVWETLVNVVRQLRQLCPWDRKQTHASLRHLLIEEAYETVEALDHQDMPELSCELGDLLLQIILHSIIAEEEGHFDLADVITHVTDKMVYRHPHVFEDLQVSGVDEVLENWETLKAKEKDRTSVLSGVPIHLPALLCAYRMQQKAANVGFDFPDQSSTWEKVEEEIQEFKSAATDKERENEFGDVLFALVNYARKNNINPEDALRESNHRFRSRLGYVESKVNNIEHADHQELDSLWEESKSQ
ncbi:MAG: nucleoside triphosphate pyrophosphohydrolase [Bacteroidetes bacterium]|nr:nucleoside triphosphate pyrophosphohydrolase [Bacteroidota bacterium]